MACCLTHPLFALDCTSRNPQGESRREERVAERVESCFITQLYQLRWSPTSSFFSPIQLHSTLPSSLASGSVWLVAFLPCVRRFQKGESLRGIKQTNKPTKSNAGSVGGNEINHLSPIVSGSTLLHKDREDWEHLWWVLVCRRAAWELHKGRGCQFVWVTYGGLGLTKERRESTKQLGLGLTKATKNNKKKDPTSRDPARRRALFKQRGKK